MRETPAERATAAELAARVRGHEGLARVLRNVSWLVGERGVALALNFAVGVWFVNYLGAADYGTYAYVVSFVALFAAVAAAGTSNLVVRDLSRAGADHGEILGTAFVLRVASSVAALGLILAAAALTGGAPGTPALIAIAALSVLSEPAQVVDLWFQSRIESKYVVWVRTATLVGSVAVRAAFLALGMPLVAFVWLYAGQALATGIGLVALYLARRPVGLVLRASAARARALVAESWPLVVAGVSVTVYMRIDRVMLGQLLDAGAVGTYATAAMLSEAWNFVPVVLASSMFPVVVRSREAGDPERYRRRMQALYDAMALVGYAVAVPTTLLAGPIVRLLFSEEFQAAVPVLRLYVWSFPFVALGVARTRHLLAEDRVMFPMLATLAGGVVNVALNWVLIPRFAGIGAAVATLVAYALAAWAAGFVVPAVRPITRQITLALLAPLRLGAVWRGVRDVL